MKFINTFSSMPSYGKLESGFYKKIKSKKVNTMIKEKVFIEQHGHFNKNGKLKKRQPTKVKLALELIKKG